MPHIRNFMHRVALPERKEKPFKEGKVKRAQEVPYIRFFFI